jgi:hypothetical protein
MKRAAREHYRLAANAQECALRASDLYIRLVWLDIAEHWRDLAAFAAEMEREASTSDRKNHRRV